MASSHSHVWGSGMLDPEQSLDKLAVERIHALRGELTLARARSYFPDLGDIPLGDPGILIDRIPDVRRAAAETPDRTFGVVPHHAQADIDYYRTLARDPNVRIIDMRDNTLAPVLALARSEIIVSSSLHGLIFAAALGKPYVWMAQHKGDKWAYKFRDWFSTTDNPQDVPEPLHQTLAHYEAAAALRPFNRDAQALIDAFPGWSVPELHSPGPIVDFETLRAAPWITMTLSEPGPLHVGPLKELIGTPAGRERLGAIVTPALRLTNSWSEPVYTCILSSGMALDNKIMMDIVATMDHDPGCDALFLETAAQAGDRRNDYLAPDEATTPVGLFLRPSRGGAVISKPRRYVLPAPV